MAQVTREQADADPRLTASANWQDPQTHVYARGFGKRLRMTLISRQITRQELAKQLGVANNLVQAWVVGRRLPSMPILPKLCQTLNVDAHWLLGLQRDRQTLGNLPDVLPQRFSINDSAEDLEKVGAAYLEMAKEAWRLATMRRLSERVHLVE